MTDDGLRDLNTLLDQMTALIQAVDADALVRPTPCSGWTVRDLTEHVIGTTTKFADGVAGKEIDWAADTTVMGDPAEAFAAAASALRTAYETPAEAATPDWQCAELATHTWDLATALGHDTGGLDPAPAERGLAFMRANLGEEMRGAHFGPEQTAPDGADAYQRIAAFAGRPVA